MRIIGPPSATLEVTRANLTRFTPHVRFLNEMFPALWGAGVRYLVDPVGMVAQALKETGNGNFRGLIRPEFYNTCGLKLRHLSLFPETTGEKPLAHSAFASWDVGAEAHAQHLRAYAGFPVTDRLIVDPRYWLVVGQHRETWAELSGGWAPGAAYGAEIESAMARLQGAA
jgi:hypothetical protein